jgi:hypothetical protein
VNDNFARLLGGAELEGDRRIEKIIVSARHARGHHDNQQTRDKQDGRAQPFAPPSVQSVKHEQGVEFQQ